MANVLINDLMPVGSGFFADSETFIDSINDLSENELRMTFGGSKSKSKSKSKSSKSGSSRSFSSGCGFPCGHGYHC
jgi:hypothetical protein